MQAALIGLCWVNEALAIFALNVLLPNAAKKRWGAHWPIMIGCVASMAIVLPLVFGVIHFATPENDFTKYQLQIFHIPVITFPIDSFFAKGLFHGLVYATMPVVIGLAFAMIRRWRDRGDKAVGRLSMIGCRCYYWRRLLELA